MSFLNAMAGLSQGTKDYQAWQQDQAAQKQAMQYQQMQMQAYAQQQQQAQQDRMNQGQMAQAQMIEIQSRQQRPPMPGQASQAQQPMQPQQQPMQYGQKQMGPQAASPIPPYQSMQTKQPQQPMQQPQQQQPQDQGMIPAKPQKNEFEQLTDILAAKGITSPEAVLAAFQGRVSAQQAQALAQTAAAKADRDERGVKVKEAHEQNWEADQVKRGQKTDAEIAKLSAQTQGGFGNNLAPRSRRGGGSGGGSGGGLGGGKAGGLPATDAIEVAAWDYLLKNAIPPKRGGTYEKVMGYVGKLAKDNDMSVQQIVSASADTKSKLAAKKSFEIRAQNMTRAENQLMSEMPVLEKAMKALDVSKYPAIANLEIAVLRNNGDSRIVALDQSADTVFREFEGIITGNPGTLNVQDIQNAKEAYHNARTPQNMVTAIAGMKRIITNAKGSLDTTRREIMGDINSGFSKKKSEGPKSGTVENGYRFKGGDPGKQENWEKQ